MTVDFCDYFWTPTTPSRLTGEKNNGFDVLYHNMKYGLVASKELAEFFRERSTVEETHSKLLAKLAKQAGNGCTQGTFAPLWQVLKSSSEKLSGLHLQMVQRVQEMVKEVSKYAEELHRKHKQVKEEESGTLEVVQAIQSTTATLQKAKDAYTQRGLELEKLKREGSSPKEVEKAEAKFRKAHEDYKNLVEKYCLIRDEFERKMTLACKHFQEVEDSHLKQMKDFLNTYSHVMENNHELIGQVHVEFRRQCVEMTVDKLLEQFVLNKHTGLEKPGPVEFEEGNFSLLTSVSNESSEAANGDKSEKPSKKEGNKEPARPSSKAGKSSRRTTSLLNLFMSSSSHQGSKESEGAVPQSSSPTSAPTSPPGDTPTNGNVAASLARNTFRGSKWDSPSWSPYSSISSWTAGFLRSRRERKREKRAKKKKEPDSSSNMEDKSDTEEKEDSHKSETHTPEVDEEGYSIKPKGAPSLWENDKSSFYSSSDSDSDDERERKIHVEIKPLSNGSAPISASVDELRATVETLSLSPVGMISGRKTTTVEQDNQMKRSQSVSQQLGKPSSDLLGLNLFSSPTPSSASTPTGGVVSAVPAFATLHSPPSLRSPPPLHSPPPPPHSTPPPSSSPYSGRSQQESAGSTPGSGGGRYAELGDLFAEVGEMQPSLPPKQHRQSPSRGGGTPTAGIVLPRPPSRRGEVITQRGQASPSTISRADSVGSLEFKASGVGLGVSRGPSPLTIGMADTIPLAVAFHEMVHAYFRGTDETKCQARLAGDMMVSFPTGIIQLLANNPSPAQLSFRMRNTQRLEAVLPNKQLVTLDTTQRTNDNLVFEFNMSALTALLRRQSEQNPSASYFNVDILKYQIKPKVGAGSCPFQLVAFWKCEPTHTDLRVDYKYNSHAMASASPLLNLTVAVPVDGGVKGMQSKPCAQWLAETNRAIWKFTELSQHSENHGVGSLRARLEVTKGPSTPGTIAAQFNCEGTTLSGTEFELVGTGYRLSLVKRRFVSGKYICDADADSRNRYAVPPGPGSSQS